VLFLFSPCFCALEECFGQRTAIILELNSLLTRGFLFPFLFPCQLSSSGSPTLATIPSPSDHSNCALPSESANRRLRPFFSFLTFDAPGHRTYLVRLSHLSKEGDSDLHTRGPFFFLFTVCLSRSSYGIFPPLFFHSLDPSPCNQGFDQIPGPLLPFAEPPSPFRSTNSPAHHLRPPSRLPVAMNEAILMRSHIISEDFLLPDHSPFPPYLFLFLQSDPPSFRRPPPSHEFLFERCIGKM